MKRSKLYPNTVALELTYNCNNSCIFCSCPWFSTNFPVLEELTTDEWKRIIDLLVIRGISSITLTGVEALLRSDSKELIDYIGAKETIRDKSIISNGVLLNEEIIKLLKKNDFSLSISLPGIKTYKNHTKNYSYEEVLAKIALAKSYGLRVTANITVTQLNIDELYENLALPLIHGADQILLNRFLPGGRGLKYREQLELTKNQINNMLNTAETVLRTARRKGSVGTELPYCIVDNPDRYEYLNIGYICSAAKSFFVIDPSGYVRACNHSEHRLVKFMEFEGDDYWDVFQSRAYIPEICIDCSMVSYCDAGCREAAKICYGDCEALDPVFETSSIEPKLIY